jgi:hypothetical protein
MWGIELFSIGRTSLAYSPPATTAQFKKKKAPAPYRYDSSLAPTLEWDGQNPAREQGEEQLSVISSQWSVARDRLTAVRSRLATAQRDLTADEVAALTDDCELTHWRK